MSEVKIGKMLREIPKLSGGDRKSENFKNRPHSNFDLADPDDAPEEFPELEMKNQNNSAPKPQEDAAVPEWEEQHEADGKELERTEEIPQFNTNIGADGKERPRQVERKQPPRVDDTQHSPQVSQQTTAPHLDS